MKIKYCLLALAFVLSVGSGNAQVPNGSGAMVPNTPPALGIYSSGIFDVNGSGTLTNAWPNTVNSTPGSFTAGQGLVYAISTLGQNALYLATRSSDRTGSGGTTFALEILAQSDSTSKTNTVWGQYIQAEMLTGSLGGALMGVENSVLNQLVAATEDPYTSNPTPASRNARFDCGVGAGLRSATNCTAAVDILNNGGAYISGIVFGSTALTGTNPCALCLPSNYAITWYNGAASIGSQIYSDGSNNLTFAFNGTVNATISQGGVLNLGAGTGSNYLQIDGGRAFYGYNSATNATSIGGGTSKGFEVRVGGTNGTFLTGTLALAISSAALISIPTVATGTPVASLCIDASNNIIKKTTTGACI